MNVEDVMREDCAEEAEISEDEHQSGLDEIEPGQIDDERQNDDAPPNEWSRDISLADQVKLGWIAHQKVRQGADFGKFCRRLAPEHPMRKEGGLARPPCLCMGCSALLSAAVVHHRSCITFFLGRQDAHVHIPG